MKTVHKYGGFSPGDLADRSGFCLDMPSGAKVLSAVNQRNRLCVYAEVDHSRQKNMRTFACVETGGPLPKPAGRWQFIDTVLLDDGAFVLHVYVHAEAS